MSDHVGIRFRVGDLFPANKPVARWLTVCAMALNDLLLVNRKLLPSLEGDGPDYINVYLGRLGAAHLYETSKFLHESERRVPEVAPYVAGLDQTARDAYERVKAAGPGGSGLFAEQLEHARNHFFHYPRLLPHASDYEDLLCAMEEHKDSVSEIHDPGQFIEFRARFADDIGVELSYPEASVDLKEFVTALSEAISDYLTFAVPALVRYIESEPPDKWEFIDPPPS